MWRCSLFVFILYNVLFSKFLSSTVGCFQVGTLMNSVLLKTLVNIFLVSLWTYTLLSVLPEGVVAVSLGTCMLYLSE